MYDGVMHHQHPYSAHDNARATDLVAQANETGASTAVPAISEEAGGGQKSWTSNVTSMRPPKAHRIPRATEGLYTQTKTGYQESPSARANTRMGTLFAVWKRSPGIRCGHRRPELRRRNRQNHTTSASKYTHLKKYLEGVCGTTLCEQRSTLSTGGPSTFTERMP